MMSPVAVRTLLHIFAIAEPIPNAHTPLMGDIVRDFMRAELIEVDDTGGSGFQCTEKGKRLVESICSIGYEPVGKIADLRAQIDGLRAALRLERVSTGHAMKRVAQLEHEVASRGAALADLNLARRMRESRTGVEERPLWDGTPPEEDDA